MESAPALAKEVHTILVEVAACELIGHYAAAAMPPPPRCPIARDFPPGPLRPCLLAEYTMR